MKATFVIRLCAAGCLWILAGAARADDSEASIPEAERRAVAIGFADRLAAKDFEGATERFDETMMRLMGPEKLEDTWKKIAAQCGDFSEFSAPRHETVGGYDSYFFPGKWKAVALDMQVTVTKDGKITGLFFKQSAAATPYRAPSYVKKKQFSERDLEFGKPDWRLKAKLSIPRKARNAPGVVLVHGSGPNDMDETIGSNRPFRDLAWGLASRGIVVLRYDKRTHTHGAQMTSKEINVHDEVVDDAVLALTTLREQSEVDPQKTFVIGHSLGGCLAPIIAEEDGALAGVIILAGTLRPMEDVLIEQLEYIAGLPGPGQAEAKKILKDSRRELESFRAGEAEAKPTLLGAPMAYWQDMTAHLGERGGKAIRAFDGRVLIVNGGRASQIKSEDLDH